MRDLPKQVRIFCLDLSGPVFTAYDTERVARPTSRDVCNKYIRADVVAMEQDKLLTEVERLREALEEAVETIKDFNSTRVDAPRFAQRHMQNILKHVPQAGKWEQILAKYRADINNQEESQ